MRTGRGSLTALPLSNELDDYTILAELRHSEPSFARQVRDHHLWLQREAAAGGGGRLMTLSLRPWIIGQPHRISVLRAGLQDVVAGGVWSATGADIVAACEPHLPT